VVRSIAAHPGQAGRAAGASLAGQAVGQALPRADIAGLQARIGRLQAGGVLAGGQQRQVRGGEFWHGRSDSIVAQPGWQGEQQVLHFSYIFPTAFLHSAGTLRGEIERKTLDTSNNRITYKTIIEQEVDAMLTRWDPFREMFALRRAMDRVFDRALEPAWTETVSWDLPLDVIENMDAFLVKASIPGVNPDDLEITFSNDVLTIKGETKAEREVKEEQYHLRERRFGSFSRSISLPNKVKAEAIQASYDQGVLTLHLPKTEEVKPRKIAIKSGSSAKMIEGKVK
jgi:HSP20 family protein